MQSYPTPNPQPHLLPHTLPFPPCPHLPAGADFYLRVKLPPAGAQPGSSPGSSSSADTLIAAAATAAQGPVDELARRSASKLYFTAPEVPVAGAPARLYFNRARSWELRHNPNAKASELFSHVFIQVKP